MNKHTLEPEYLPYNNLNTKNAPQSPNSYVETSPSSTEDAHTAPYTTATTAANSELENGNGSSPTIGSWLDNPPAHSKVAMMENNLGKNWHCVNLSQSDHTPNVGRAIKEEYFNHIYHRFGAQQFRRRLVLQMLQKQDYIPVGQYPQQFLESTNLCIESRQCQHQPQQQVGNHHHNSNSSLL
jgi:hypothetical protein